jgi:hypothetical protein
VTIPRQVTAELVPPREWAGKPIRVLRAPAKPAETGQHTFTLPAAGPYTFEVER